MGRDDREAVRVGMFDTAPPWLRWRSAVPPHKGEGEARAKPGKLSFKDQHRLKELDALIHTLPADIAAHQKRLDDVNFYARDPSGFASTMKALEAAQAKLNAAEEEWLELEAKREALGAA